MDMKQTIFKMTVHSLKDLSLLAEDKRSVTAIDGKIMGRTFLPARVLLNMSGEIILREFNKGLIIYKPSSIK